MEGEQIREEEMVSNLIESSYEEPNPKSVFVFQDQSKLVLKKGQVKRKKK